MRLLRIREVVEKTGCSHVTIWRKERGGEFPKRRRIGPNTVAWLESEIDAWIESRPLADPESEKVSEADVRHSVIEASAR
jgi:prophage regulatory protein